MEDSAEDLGAPGPLGACLRRCHEALRTRFREADERAVRHQRAHRRLTAAVAVAGTLALWLTSFNFLFEPGLPSYWLEAACVLVTFLLVGVGLRRRWHGNWLLWRFKAERYRLLKFRTLVDPLLWTAGAGEAWTRSFSEEIERIGRLEHEDLQVEASREDTPRTPPEDLAARVAVADLPRLAGYCRRRRLSLQIEYFAASARKARPANRLWAPLVFFASVLFSGVQVGMELAAATGAVRPDRTYGVFVRIFLLASLWIPALFAGARTYQAANEIARNRSRSLARAAALSELTARLPAEKESIGAGEAATLFMNLALAESILAGDQREWLRLMLEAEWYR